MNTEFLNTIKSEIVKTANENGIDLNNEFKSPADFKEFVISFAIKTVINNTGYTMEKAYDLVLGEGSYKDIYNGVLKQVNP